MYPFVILIIRLGRSICQGVCLISLFCTIFSDDFYSILTILAFISSHQSVSNLVRMFFMLLIIWSFISFLARLPSWAFMASRIFLCS